MNNIYNYKTEAEYAKDAAMDIEDFVAFKLENQESVSIALSGGKSPIAVYKELAKKKQMQWDKIELFMVDERYVPQDAKESNFKMINDVLLSKLRPVKSFDGFNTNLPLEEAAKVYDQILEKRGKKCFDLVILGMGEDGHTASLFPKSKALKEKEKLATTSQSPDKMDRLTITFPAIYSAEKVMFLVRGDKKKDMLNKLADEKATEKDFPAKMVMKHCHVDVFVL